MGLLWGLLRIYSPNAPWVVRPTSAYIYKRRITGFFLPTTVPEKHYDMRCDTIYICARKYDGLDKPQTLSNSTEL